MIDDKLAATPLRTVEGDSVEAAPGRGILVLGMHRSGTSAVARVLGLMGAHIGEEDELLPAHVHDNPSGYWERSELMLAHDRALAESGYAWDRLAGFDTAQVDAAAATVLSEQIAQTIARLCARGSPWLVKDPRLCLLLPWWLDQAPDAACVVVVRDPREITASLIETDRGIYTSHFLLALWEKYLRGLLATLHGRRALFVAYEHLLSEPQGQCVRILDGMRTLGISGLHGANAQISQFLDTTLRRSRPGSHVRMSEQQTALYAWLRMHAGHPDPIKVDDAPRGNPADAVLFEFQRAQDECANRVRAQTLSETQALTEQINEARHQRNLTAIELEQSNTDKEILVAQVDEERHQRNLIGAELERSNKDREVLAARVEEMRREHELVALELGQARAKVQAVETLLRTVSADRDTALSKSNATSMELDEVRHQRNITAMHLAQSRRHAQELRDTVDALRASLSWKITAPIRGLGGLFRLRLSGAGEQRLHRLYYAIPGINAARKRDFIAWLHRHMPWLTRHTFSYRLAQQAVQLHDAPTSSMSDSPAPRMDDERATQFMKHMKVHPLISVVMPVYNVERHWLVAAVESVRRQFYPHWELCIADDASSRQETRDALREINELGDPRIRILRLNKNAGIAGASNAALKLASGEYVGLLDHDDELTRDALLEAALAIEAGNPDIIYSDEDKLDTDGRHCEPHFKPDFSLEYFLSINYLCHFSVIRRKLLEDIGGFRTGFDGAQDFDLLLRATEHGGRVMHIPKILYHWRKIESSTASRSGAKPAASDAGLRALRESVQRRGIDAAVEPGPYSTTYRVRRAIIGKPLVSIILPFRDKPELLAMCVRSILARTDYPHFEIVGIDNGSTDAVTHALMDELRAKDARVRFIRHDVPFNYSAINNFGARQADGEHLLFLNNDTEIFDGGWLRAMLEHSQRADVGVVGAKLLYPDDRIQHGGVIVGIGGVAGHAHLLQPGDHPGYFARAQLPQELSAVTFACAMTRRAVFEQMGGLNERELTIAFNDIDYCLRVREAGYLVVYTPYAALYHHESRTRGYEDNPEKQTRFAGEIAYMQQRHAAILQRGDPYYNPNLRLDLHDFSPRPGYVETLPR